MEKLPAVNNITAGNCRGSLPAPLAPCEAVRPRALSRRLLAPGPQTRPHGSYLAVSPSLGLVGACLMQMGALMRTVTRGM